MFSKNGNNQIIHLLRYDDLSAASNVKVEQGLIQLLLRNSLPCTFATIPFVCDPNSLLVGSAVKLQPFPREKANLLKDLRQAGLAEIALHGYSHLSLAPLRDHQEFSDAMPLECQRSLIRRGRQYLEDTFGTKVTLFVPPWNRLSASTARILQEEGLYCSSDIHGDPSLDHNTIPQLPCGVGARGTARALRTAQKFGGRNVVGTVLHDYDFVESGYNVGTLSFSEFEGLVASWLEFKSVRRMLVGDAIRTGNGLAEKNEANSLLRQYVRKRRVFRLLLRGAELVFWDTRRAKHLISCARFLP